MSLIPTPNPPEGAKLPQEDYIEVLEKIRLDIRAITIDGPSGNKFKAVLDRLVGVMLEVL